jgi:hypothetical protein
MADIGALFDVELDQEVEFACGRVDLRRNLGVGERVGNRVGLAEMTFDLNEKRDHFHLLDTLSQKTGFMRRIKD